MARLVPRISQGSARTVSGMSVDLAIPSTTGVLGTQGRAAAAAAFIGAALIHATVVADHYHGWVLAGLFFLALQVAETLLGLAVLLVPGRQVAVAGVACNLATIGVWALSRTVGLPFGPAEFRIPEAVGTADLGCLLLEATAIALLLPTALGRGPAYLVTAVHAQRTRAVVSAVLVAAMAMVTLWGLGPALSGEGHHHSHDAAAAG